MPLRYRHLPDVDSDAILSHLTTRQHLRPHAPLGEVLDEAIELLGCCPQAVARGTDWMGIQPTRPIGRLRRSELVQLARAIHRFWAQNLSAGDTAAPAPTKSS